LAAVAISSRESPQAVGWSAIGCLSAAAPIDRSWPNRDIAAAGLPFRTAVKDAAVVCLPDAKRGEAVQAAVIVHEGASVSAPELLDWNPDSSSIVG